MRSPHQSDKAAESQQHVPASAAVGTGGPIPTPAFGERVVGAAAIAGAPGRAAAARLRRLVEEGAQSARVSTVL